MKKADSDLRPEYKRSDFTRMERGKFTESAIKGATVVVLEAPLAKAFPSSKAVNEALRALLDLTEQTSRITRRSPARNTKRRAA